MPVLRPLLLLLLAALTMRANGQVGTPASPSTTTIDEVVITSREPTWNFETGVAEFVGGVVARYGVTKIVADRLTMHSLPNERFGVASGNVQLIDPDGTVSADTLRFSWRPEDRYATGENIVATIAGATISARTADIRPAKWVLTDIRGTTCRNNPPLYEVSGRKLTVYPGKSGQIQRPSLSIFGIKAITLPSQSFNLDPRAEGFKFPTLAYRKDEGIGVAWTSGIFLRPDTIFNADLFAFPNRRPGYGASIVRTFVPADQSRGLVAPKSELSERFAFGYFESIEIERPEQEPHYLSSKQSTLALGTSWSANAAGRGVGGYSKAADLVYEWGGKQGGFGMLSQLRAQAIRRLDGPFITRSVFQTSVEAPSLALGPQLTTLMRVDGAGFAGKNPFGWVRASGGLIYSPWSRLKVGGALYTSVQGGTPDFDIDPLNGRHGFLGRVDLNLGGFRAGYLAKFDVDRRWFDREYTVAQAVGCVDLYVLYRQVPQNYRFGVRLRLDQFFDLLQRRKFDRTGRTTILSSPQRP